MAFERGDGDGGLGYRIGAENGEGVMAGDIADFENGREHGRLAVGRREDSHIGGDGLGGELLGSQGLGHEERSG
ncbi:hypothetical protein D3C87_1772040 [compost metagenome]